MNDIKCIFLDIDGTVDNKDRVTTKYTKNVIGRLKTEGICSVICSGRMVSYAVSKSKGANCSHYVIADNGSVVYDYMNNNVIFESVFSKDLMKYIGNSCKENRVECLFNTIDGCYRYGDYNYHKYKRGRNIHDLNKIKKNITQIIISSIYYEDIEKVRNLVLKLGNIQVSNTNMNKKLEDGRAYYCDLNILGNSKGNAILKLLDYLDIDVSNTLKLHLT